MGLSFRVESVAHNSVHVLTGDKSGAFMRICKESIGKTQMLGYVIPFGDTMFNSFQLTQFIVELDEAVSQRTFSDDDLEILKKILGAAEEARKINGYLVVLGD